MEQEKKANGIKHFGKLFLIALSIFSAMLLCYFSGYQLIRDDKEKTEPNMEQTQKMTAQEDTQTPSEPYNFEHLTAMHPEENITVEDEKDYLVILEHGTVNLYHITKDGKEVFERALGISPAALLEEDRLQLARGIRLSSETALSSLLEDYTS